MKIIVTGSAGFIGSAVTLRLLEDGHEILGIDNLNNYYDPELKKARLSRHINHENYTHISIDLQNTFSVMETFAMFEPTRVIHLAAQPGVRYSIDHPLPYIHSNINGFISVLEACRHYGVEHLVYASSSSVYGANIVMPFSTHHNVDHPVSLYAATKKSNELMAHTYSHLYNLPTTGLRFFTVYGPYDRPDMALQTFTQKILAEEPINVFNQGRHKRDFTYINDIVEGVIRVVDKIPTPDITWDRSNPDPATSSAPYRVYNIGNNNPVELMTMIELLESHLGVKAEKNMLPMQPGDVEETYADIDDLIRDIGYKPITKFEDGIKHFVDWYKDYYGEQAASTSKSRNERETGTSTT